MPNDKDQKRHRMVVEEVEVPSNTETEEKPEVIEENEKVSSQELTGNKEVQLTDSNIEEKHEEKAPEENVEKPANVDRPLASMPAPQKQKSPVFWILIPGIFILGAILGGVVFYQRGVSNKSSTVASPTPVAEEVVQASPSASPEATIDISEFEIAVYNGSGTAGEASKVKTLLEDAGFSVVSTGNAASYDYTKTIIKAKSTVDASVIQKLEDAISGDYVVGDSQTLTSSATTDIQVVVGSSKAE